MGNIIVSILIGVILYLAIKPIIRFRREKGSEYACFKCSSANDNKCSGCSIKK